jgi:hypothetical protein
MKTNKFILLCFLLGIGLTTLSAQNGKNGTGTVTGSYTSDEFWPVYCGDKQVDYLVGPITYHYEAHFKDGKWKWSHGVGFGEAVSVGFKDDNENLIGGTGEVFNVKEIDKKETPTSNYFVVKWNLVGNKGSHYIGTLLLAVPSFEFTSVRAVCPGNDD